MGSCEVIKYFLIRKLQIGLSSKKRFCYAVEKLIHPINSQLWWPRVATQNFIVFLRTTNTLARRNVNLPLD